MKGWETLWKHTVDERKMGLSKYDEIFCYPPKEKIFRAFELTPLSDTKVVILGMDPYHNGAATGLAFSVEDEKRSLNPSLKNILKEVNRQGKVYRRKGDLTSWAEQGVLLINTALTVTSGKAGSHLQYWIPFTKKVLQELAEDNNPKVFMLWGKKAQDLFNHSVKNHEHHLVLQAGHPSPLAGKRFEEDMKKFPHFTVCNQFIRKQGLEEILF